jgi:hypothetical protein
MSEQDGETKTLKGKAFDYLAYWMRDTTPLHKILDVLILAVAGMLGIALWTAYQSQDRIVDMVGVALQKYPSIDMSELESGWESAWTEAQYEGAVAIEAWSVDLSDNTRRLLKSRTTDTQHGGILERMNHRPLLSHAMTQESIEVFADLITGDPGICLRPLNDNLIGLYIPIPDSPGRLLCGVLIVSFPVDVPRENMKILRQNLLAYSERLAGN